MKEKNKEILIDFGDWAVVKIAQDYGNSIVRYHIYAEHMVGCKPDRDMGDRHNSFEGRWSWESHDPINTNFGYHACWECKARVPDEAVALVLLYNEKKI